MMSFHLFLLMLETDVHRCEGGAVVCNNTLGKKKAHSQLILSIMHRTALGCCQDTLSGCQHQKITRRRTLTVIRSLLQAAATVSVHELLQMNHRPDNDL